VTKRLFLETSVKQSEFNIIYSTFPIKGTLELGILSILNGFSC